MASRISKADRNKVGDKVRFDFGGRRVTGVIVEDVGPIGIGGRHVFTIEFPIAETEPMRISLMVDEFKKVERRAFKKVERRAA